MTCPSKFGALVITLSFFLYLVSMQSQSGILFLILGILFGCFVINYLKAKKSIKLLTLIPPDTITAVEGKPVNGTWKFENQSNTDIGHIQIQGPWEKFASLGLLSPNSHCYITPKTMFKLRGIYSFDAFKLISSYPFGLVHCRRKIKCAGEVVVYPRVYPCIPPRAAGFEPMLGGKFSGKYKSRTGDQFHGVRPLLPQDPVKFIHWPSSSKGQGLMVKEFDEEVAGRVSLIMGCDVGEKFAEDTALDWAARAAGSLILSSLDYGYQVEFVNLADREALKIPPFDDGDNAMKYLSGLLEDDSKLTRKNLSAAFNKLSRKSGLCFIMSDVNSALIEFLNDAAIVRNRKVTIYIPNYLRDRLEGQIDRSIILRHFNGEEIIHDE